MCKNLKDKAVCFRLLLNCRNSGNKFNNFMDKMYMLTFNEIVIS